MPNAIIVDTNVLVHDPKAFDFLLSGGNTMHLPWSVITELDSLKTKPDIGYDAREAITKIEDLQMGGCKQLFIECEPNFSKNRTGSLDSKNPDHRIIATAISIFEANRTTKNGQAYEKVKLLSRDRTVRILSRRTKPGLVVENYHRDESEVAAFAQPREIVVDEAEVDGEGYFTLAEIDEIADNESVICNFGEMQFAARRKGERFKIVDDNIKAFGVGPLSVNGNGRNWHQTIALDLLLDQDVPLVFLKGGAGTGKTLLAVAAALEQRKHYRQILISRPMVHLEDEDNMGFLPGNIEEKSSPWMRPIEQALFRLCQNSSDDYQEKKLNLVTKWRQEKKIIFEPLDYIRGMTYFRDFLIIDDAQNLTPHQVKTIITRAGEGSKLVFTGDLGQIDRRRRLDARSSGLNYAINRLGGESLVGVAIFKDSVRSDLVRLAEQRL